MNAPTQVSIYRWADAPKNSHRPFARSHRDWIIYVPKGCTLVPTHWGQAPQEHGRKKQPRRQHAGRR